MPLQTCKRDDEWFLEGLVADKSLADSDHDGIPNQWDVSHSLNPKDQPDITQIVPAGNRHQGYIYIEFHLNELADNLVPR